MSWLGFTQGLPGSEGYVSASWNLSWRYITDPHSRRPLHCWTNLPWKTHRAWYLVTGRLNGKHPISIQWLCEHSETSLWSEDNQLIPTNNREVLGPCYREATQVPDKSRVSEISIRHLFTHMHSFLMPASQKCCTAALTLSLNPPETTVIFFSH